MLLEQWSIPTTDIAGVDEQLRNVEYDLFDAGRAVVPTTLAIGTRGLFAVRTLRGIEVHDVRSGELRWAEPFDPISNELLISGIAGNDGRSKSEKLNLLRAAHYDPNNGDQHPLPTLLYRDTVQGAVDRRQTTVRGHRDRRAGTS
ncbi:MAG: hypothetical protein R3B90_17125 [Planctomycetaceae bacterium]